MRRLSIRSLKGRVILSLSFGLLVSALLLIAWKVNTEAKAWVFPTQCYAYIESISYTTDEDGITSGEFGDGARITGYESDADTLVTIDTIMGVCTCYAADQATDDSYMDEYKLEIWVYDTDQDGAADADDTTGSWITMFTADPDGDATHHTIGRTGTEGNLLQAGTTYVIDLDEGWYLMRIHATNWLGHVNATYATTYIDEDGTGDWDDDEVVSFHLNRKPGAFEFE